MSEKDAPSAFFRELMNQSKSISAANGYAEAFWKSQAAVAEHMQKFMDHWYSRRQDAAAAAATCCARMAKGENAAEAAEAWLEWSRDAVERLGEDARAQAELTAALPNEALNAFSRHAPAGKPAAGTAKKPRPSGGGAAARSTRSANGQSSRPQA